MGANCLIFDDCLISGAPIERTKRGLNACASDASEYLRSLRSVAAQLIRPALMKHSARESAETEDPLIAQLVASSKDGDSAAMELLIERYQSRVAGFVFACVGDGQAVEDLCQTIFYKMLVGLRFLFVTLDFDNWDHFEMHHYAFHVSDAEFDAIFGRIKEAGIPFGSGPFSQEDMQINHRRGGRGVYFKEPNGHVLELLTRE